MNSTQCAEFDAFGKICLPPQKKKILKSYLPQVCPSVRVKRNSRRTGFRVYLHTHEANVYFDTHAISTAKQLQTFRKSLVPLSSGSRGWFSGQWRILILRSGLAEGNGNATMYLPAEPDCWIRISHCYWCLYRRTKGRVLSSFTFGIPDSKRADPPGAS